MVDDGAQKYWFNQRTGEVERGFLSPAIYRIGPFETPEQAQSALDTIRERNAAWDAEDAADR